MLDIGKAAMIMNRIVDHHIGGIFDVADVTFITTVDYGLIGATLCRINIAQFSVSTTVPLIRPTGGTVSLLCDYIAVMSNPFRQSILITLVFGVGLAATFSTLVIIRALIICASAA